jgi:hypothetical protein
MVTPAVGDAVGGGVVVVGFSVIDFCDCTRKYASTTSIIALTSSNHVIHHCGSPHTLLLLLLRSWFFPNPSPVFSSLPACSTFTASITVSCSFLPMDKFRHSSCQGFPTRFVHLNRFYILLW